MTTINTALEQLEYLKLKSSYEYLKELIKDNAINEHDLLGLIKVLKKEVQAKDDNNKLYNVKVAAFPFLSTIQDYDFDFQPSIKKENITSVLDSNFYEDGTNIVFVGNPGVGKTHLAIAIGYEVAIKRNSVYFIKFSKLINQLKQSHTEGVLEKKLKLFFKYKLLIVDEVGFNEISPLEAKLFFQLIDMRYNKRSTIITTNIYFDKWPTILGQDEMLTKAILDRVLHHSFLFNINGQSYRIKDKLNPKKREE